VATMLEVSGEILEDIKAGNWTSIEEIIGQTDLAEEKLIKILDFLSEFGFIEFDSDKKRIRIDYLGKKLLELPDA